MSLLAFILILNFDGWSLFSRYGFYIIVSGLCWISLLIILVVHGIGVCASKVYGKWQREYSLFVFMLSYSLSFLFLFFFGSALLAQWAYDMADGFLILCVVSEIRTFGDYLLTSYLSCLTLNYQPVLYFRFLASFWSCYSSLTASSITSVSDKSVLKKSAGNRNVLAHPMLRRSTNPSNHHCLLYIFMFN